MSIYVLSRGSYSDYRVLCACPSEAEAVALAEKVNARRDTYEDEVMVEELPTADSSTERVEVLSMQVEIWDDGSEGEVRRVLRVEWPFDTLYSEDVQPVRWRWVRAPVHHNKGGRLEVAGTDHERVRKVFSDRRAMLKTDDALRAKREQRGRK